MKLRRKLFYFTFVLSVTLGTLLVLSQINKPQETRSRAASSTTLSLVPASSSKQVGDIIDLDMMIDPGSNLVSFIKFQLTFDSTKLELATDPFTINAAAFPIKVEGPVVNSESIGESLSIGADATKVVQNVTKVGTLHLKALGPTNSTPATISFTNLTQVLSTGGQDTPTQSVLSSTTPATINIGGDSQVTPTTTLTPGPKSGSTATFVILLHGVGSSGDNPNPNGNSLSNKAPVHPQRNLDVSFFNTKNQLAASISGAINYDAGSGSYKGSIDLGPNLPQGNYNVKVKTDRYLRRLIKGAQKIKPGEDNKITQVALVAGDTNSDNLVDVLDYNAFLDCGYGALEPLPIDDANSIFNKNACQIHTPAVNIDLNDNGIVDSTDYNLFLRELSVQSGD